MSGSESEQEVIDVEFGKDTVEDLNSLDQALVGVDSLEKSEDYDFDVELDLLFKKFEFGELEVPEEFDDFKDLVGFWKDSKLLEPYYDDFDSDLIFEEVGKEWLDPPYSYKTTLLSEKEKDKLYYVNEPQLSDYEETLKDELESRLRNTLMYEEFDIAQDDRSEILRDNVDTLLDKYGLDIEENSLRKIMYYLERDFINYGKIDPIMQDPTIEDISCDGVDIPIFVYHQEEQDMMTNVKFEDADELSSYVTRLAQKCGKHISVSDPLVDANTPEGSRIQLGFEEEVTPKGSTFTMRKFSEEPFTPVDLIKFNTFSIDQMAYLWTCIENNKSLIFAGGTASGKTTSMNAVSMFIPPKSKIVSIEDTRELTLPHLNWIPQVTRDAFSSQNDNEIDEYKLLESALRQRPEYIIVGEVRGDEALTLFQAMSTGHTTYSTMHADSVKSTIHRLENPPISVPRSMLKSLDIICIQNKTYVAGERVRRNNVIEEIKGIDPKTNNLETDNIFEWDPNNDTFIRTGESSALEDIKRSRGWDDTELEEEVAKRRKVLKYLVDNNIDGYVEVSSIIQGFITSPDEIERKIENDTIDPDKLREGRSLLPDPDEMRG